jgi:hypothetical protein
MRLRELNKRRRLNEFKGLTLKLQKTFFLLGNVWTSERQNNFRKRIYHTF